MKHIFAYILSLSLIFTTILILLFWNCDHVLGEDFYKEMCFKVTNSFFQKLSNDEIPDEVLKGLKSLETKEYTKEELLNAVKNLIGEEQTDEYKELILRHAPKYEEEDDVESLKLYKKGVSLYEEEEYADAVVYFSRVICLELDFAIAWVRNNPETEETTVGAGAYAYRAMCYLGLLKFEQACPDLEKGCKLKSAEACSGLQALKENGLCPE